MARRPRRHAATMAALVAVSLVVGACSSDGDDGGDGTPIAEAGDLAPGSAAINIVDLAFEPSTITVAPGQTEVAITNADSVDHTFTLDDGAVDEPVSAGQNVTVTVDLTDSAGFHCEIHPSMTGTLQVA